ncbi:hypothetical protein P9851_07895 [Geobacillus stearothermophilus]|uniref:hypothetical protein n=1 Tax=Geobacillus stearothermophilus TaxID=1422 RepID=UPI002E1DA282|nr:hypothetical protein [Geobacillus stearothermophilus]
MEAFWLTVSLLLHAFSFWLIILLYTRLSRLSEEEARAKRRAEELEEAMTAHLVAWKEENERFLAELDALLSAKPAAAADKRTPAPVKSRLPQQSEPGNEKESRLVNGAGSENRPGRKQTASERPELGRSGRVEQTDAMDALSDYFPDVDAIEDVVDFSPPSAHAAAIARRLEAEGMTVEEIAKKLGKGKTEVELLLKFGRKNGRMGEQ